jgi:hypothetical protein
LIEAGLLAYRKPLYQLLALPSRVQTLPSNRSGQVHSIGDLLRQLTGGVA